MRDNSARSKETDSKECASSQGLIVHPETPTPREQPQVPESIDVMFSEDRQGVKHLAKQSNGTATLVSVVFPILETAARHAMETVQQCREQKIVVSANVLLQEHPVLVKWGNRKEIEEIMNSNPGSPEPRKWAIHTMSSRLQLPADTIVKYARTRLKTTRSARSRKSKR